MAIEAGKKFDRYQILSQIGKGGMGEVFLAHDSRLNRKVALKLLPAQFIKDNERLRRFEKEAQAASALNHPNIVTIYEVGMVEDRPFIATEYIEGLTLRRRMAQGRLSVAEMLDVATQVIGALSAAHAAGIVHRDIKPENIMIRPDGYVKMLDFGLAKLTEKSTGPEGPPIDSEEISFPEEASEDTAEQPSTTDDLFATVAAGSTSETIPGIVMGTAQYMSPEQARGIRVDARTDLFSFGVVLYEMIAGRAPFSGGAPKEIIDSILKTEPPAIASVQPDVPEVFDWIVTKALVKDRDERYQSAKEMLNDLRRLHRRLGVADEIERSRTFTSGYPKAADKVITTPSDHSTMEIATPSTRSRGTSSARIFANWQAGAAPLSRNKPFLITAATLLLSLLSFGLYFWFKSRPQTAPFQSIQVNRFTSSGKANRAAVSPDGKYVVHVLSENGRQSLLVRQTLQSNYVVIVPPAEVFYRGMTFSPDGNYVYYVIQEGNNPIQALYSVPVLGGSPRKILTNIDSPAAISPNHTSLAFVRRNRGKNSDSLIVADIDGQNERQLAERGGDDFFSVSGPDFSPDGKLIACAAGTNKGGRQMFVIEATLESGKLRTVGSKLWSTVGRVSWLRNGKGLVFTAAEQGSILSQLWHLDLRKTVPRRVTSDLNDYRDISLTADARALVAVQTEAQVNVWLAPGNDSTRAAKITDGVGQYNGVSGLTWLPDGRLVYVSRASGSQDVWIMDQNGENQLPLTNIETRADRYPAVTPDGRYVVFVSTRNGNSNLYRYDLQTGEQKQLTSGSSDEFPAVSADGRWVIYTITSSIKFTLWKVSIDGGEPVQLTQQLSQWPTVSPDGQWIACWYRVEPTAKWQIAIVPIDGGTPAKILTVPSSADPFIPVRWLPDGTGVGFTATRDGVWNIWSLPLDGGPAKQLTNFTNDQIFWFDWSRDGKQLAASRGRVTSDVVYIKEP
jgi:serine/threonine protein kinase